MSILVGPQTRLVVQGLTGREGGFHAAQMAAYGTKIVAGVNLPMLLRSVCYRHEPLEGLLQRAMTGGALGVVEISSPV